MVSIFDMLENKPNAIRVTASDDDLDEVILQALKQILSEDSDVITKEFLAANSEMFKDYVVISIIKTNEKNLYDRHDDTGATSDED